MSVRINHAALDNFRRDLEQRMQGITIPLQGSESDAVASVCRPLRDRGVTPKDSAIRKAVRRAREENR